MMQYTLRKIPAAVDRALRKAAREQHKSLNQVVVETLARALGLTEEPPRKRRDLGDIVESWAEDPETQAALDDQRRIDSELWP